MSKHTRKGGETELKKKIFLFLICISVFSTNVSYASQNVIPQNPQAENIVSARFANIIRVSGSISLVNGKVHSKVTVNIRKSAPIKVKMILQKRERTSWKNIKTYSKIFSGRTSVNCSELYSASKNGSYRLYYIVTVENDSKRAFTNVLNFWSYAAY